MKIPKGQNGAGKFMPVSASGGDTWETKEDHWDECREWQHNGTYGIKVIKVNFEPPAPTYHGNKQIKSIYSGKRPPWDYPTFIECIDDGRRTKYI